MLGNDIILPRRKLFQVSNIFYILCGWSLNLSSLYFPIHLPSWRRKEDQKERKNGRFNTAVGFSLKCLLSKFLKNLSLLFRKRKNISFPFGRLSSFYSFEAPLTREVTTNCMYSYEEPISQFVPERLTYKFSFVHICDSPYFPIFYPILRASIHQSGGTRCHFVVVVLSCFSGGNASLIHIDSFAHSS